ncbi:MAG TPA: hypothetical protein VJ889_08215 [Pseudomonas sp.]|nr:hypothetical protein [Pseudomonas sp.]
MVDVIAPSRNSSLLIDTEAPVDVLHDAAAYRIRSVTQLLETLSQGEAPGGDAALLQEFARVLAIPLRDGCDLLDVVGRHFNSANKNGRPQGRPFLYPKLLNSTSQRRCSPSVMAWQSMHR